MLGFQFARRVSVLTLFVLVVGCGGNPEVASTDTGGTGEAISYLTEVCWHVHRLSTCKQIPVGQR